jgi:hypothetical protein
MLKVPTYQCSFKNGTSDIFKFIGKHEVPLLRAKVRRTTRQELVVERPASGLSAEHYWHVIPDLSAEYGRLRGAMYGEIVDEIYTTFDDFCDVVNAELEKLAGTKGVNPHIPQALVADAALVDLVTKALGPVFLPHEDATAITLSLMRLGVLTVNEVSTAPMSKLCASPMIDPNAAVKLREVAKEQEAAAALQDKAGPIEGLKEFDALEAEQKFEAQAKAMEAARVEALLPADLEDDSKARGKSKAKSKAAPAPATGGLGAISME